MFTQYLCIVHCTQTCMYMYMCAVRYSTASNVKYSVHCKWAVYSLMKLCIWDFIQLESGKGQEEKSSGCNHIRIQADLLYHVHEILYCMHAC